jgi:hypothetical protein
VAREAARLIRNDIGSLLGAQQLLGSLLGRRDRLLLLRRWLGLVFGLGRLARIDRLVVAQRVG